ncbi:glutathione S-transferase 3-like [Vipera latastei]
MTIIFFCSLCLHASELSKEKITMNHLQAAFVGLPNGSSDGRGRMESVRWLLAADGVEFEGVFLETREQYLKLRDDGCLLFGQAPMVEMDGVKLVQTKAILNYIAGKYNFLGKDLKERAQIDMYAEGTMDLMGIVLYYPFSSPEQKEKQLAAFIEKAVTRYLLVYEKEGIFWVVQELVPEDSGRPT